MTPKKCNVLNLAKLDVILLNIELIVNTAFVYLIYVSISANAERSRFIKQLTVQFRIREVRLRFLEVQYSLRRVIDTLYI